MRVHLLGETVAGNLSESDILANAILNVTREASFSKAVVICLASFRERINYNHTLFLCELVHTDIHQIYRILSLLACIFGLGHTNCISCLMDYLGSVGR